MTVATGVDVVGVSRFADVLARRPRLADRAFTAAERRECAGHPERWASRWAAKEAVRKLYGATGRRLPALADIEVTGSGKAPAVRVAGARAAIALSLTHDAGIAVAVAVGAAPDGPHAEVPQWLRLAERPDDGHKGTFGTVVVIGGAVGTSGAPLMSALAAARGGAGRVHLCVPETIYPATAAQTLEVMAHPVAAHRGGLAAEARQDLDGFLAAATALVLGPGAGSGDGAATVLLGILDRLTAPAVVDADGLNIAAARRYDWRRCPAHVVLTPHPAEMGRLLGTGTAEVQGRRLEVAREYAARSGVTLVLKGAETVVASADGRVRVSAVRAVALATGGSGDVLSGLIAALLAQGLEPFDAASAGVFLHAEAGRALQDRVGRAGALPRDLLDELPRAQERARVVVEARARP